MKNQKVFLQMLATMVVTTIFCISTIAQDNNLFIRIAKLQIDSTQLESYNAALKEEIKTSVQIEPGVLTLYAVADKSNPSSIIIFEIYASEAAYNAHRETPHFIKYKNITKEMVTSLELLNVVPVALETKKGLQIK